MNDQMMEKLRVALHSKSTLTGVVVGVETLSGRCLLAVDYEGVRIMLPADSHAVPWRLLGSEINLLVMAVDTETKTVVGMRKEVNA